MTKEESLASAIDSLRGQGLKFIKFELEANLERGHDDDYDDYETCQQCDGEGTITCECENDPQEDCAYCEGQGYYTCGQCDGSGNYETSSGSYSNDYCLEYIENTVSAECLEHTVYTGFVYDGSVDSELKVTVPLSVEGVGYWIEWIEGFKKLSKHIGNGLDVKGAGMHIALLTNENGHYPQGNGQIDERKLKNFERNMNRLMPALLFLASPDYRARPISSFRRLAVGRGTHGNAIDVANHGTTGVLEWRIFETCYERPEMVIDYLCTIAKGMKFYSDKPPELKLEKIGRLTFVDNGREYGIHKYYTTEKHLKALDVGLDILKPDHRTKEELYKLRNFTVTAERLARKRAKLEEQFEEQWQDHRKNLKDREARYIADTLANREDEPWLPTYQQTKLTAKQRKEITEQALKQFRKTNPKTKRAYLNHKIISLGERQTITV